MRLVVRILLLAGLLGISVGLLAQQGEFLGAFSSGEKTGWAFTRLRYGGSGLRGFGGYRMYSRWATDYPKADRQFVQGVRRLTRLDVRSTEQVVDPNDDELYKWPWLYAVEVGSWGFTPAQADRMREYLLRGGFLMVDDFHGAAEWQNFLVGMHAIFPDRLIEDLDNQDEIYHVLYDLTERFQVPSIQYLNTGLTYQRMDGTRAVWRGIRDDQGRIIVAICHNMDLGDAWEWADHPQYPERFTSLAYRVGINYIVYAMTH